MLRQLTRDFPIAPAKKRVARQRHPSRCFDSLRLHLCLESWLTLRLSGMGNGSRVQGISSNGPQKAGCPYLTCDSTQQHIATPIFQKCWGGEATIVAEAKEHIFWRPRKNGRGRQGRKSGPWINGSSPKGAPQRVMNQRQPLVQGEALQLCSLVYNPHWLYSYITLINPSTRVRYSYQNPNSSPAEL